VKAVFTAFLNSLIMMAYMFFNVIYNDFIINFSEGPKKEKHIIIDLLTENNTSKSVRMSVLQLNNLRHNVANLLKNTNRLKTKLQQN